MKRIRTISLALAAMLLSATASTAYAQSKAETWSYPTSSPGMPFQGSGTASSPYLISSAQDLANLAYIVTDDNNALTDVHFRLTRDIYLNDFTVNDDGTMNVASALQAWTPIGEWTDYTYDRFKGVFDGDGHTIYGLYLDTERRYAGLFGCTQDATVENLRLKNVYMNVTMTGGGILNDDCQHVGAVVGDSYATNYNNVSVASCYMRIWNKDGVNGRYGGLVGRNVADANMTDCSFDGQIRVNTADWIYVGGLVGEHRFKSEWSHYDLRFTRCSTSAASKIYVNTLKGGKATYYVGGFVGYNENACTRIYISDCVNRLNINFENKIDNYFPGLQANNFAFITGDISRSANLGNIEAKGTYGKSWMGFIFNMQNSYDCANYGRYSSTTTQYNHVLPGHNQVMHNNGKNLIVWKEADAADSTAKYTYDSTGDEYTASELSAKCDDIVAQLNQDLGSETWGYTYITSPDGTQHRVPMPVVCGAYAPSIYNAGMTMNIASAADLNTLSDMVAKGLNTKDLSVKLTADLKLDGKEQIKQIGDDNHAFEGTFDGDSHIISGATISGRALFGNLSGTVRNLTLNDITLTGNRTYGAPLAYKAGAKAKATIENCNAGGRLVLTDNANDTTSLAGLCHSVSDFGAKINNCYFAGEMANNGTKTDAQHRYFGLVASEKADNNAFGMTNCYAQFTFADTTATGAAIMPEDGRSFDSMNVHYVCPQFNSANGKVSTFDQLAECFASSEGWLAGAFRPVLAATRHFELKSPFGEKVNTDVFAYTEAFGRNDIYTYACAQIDDMLRLMPNVAILDAKAATYNIASCTLNPDAPLHYAPAKATVTKGLMTYDLVIDDTRAALLCLPGAVSLSNLPDGTKLVLAGTIQGNSTDGYTSPAIECENVPAGVPFILAAPGNSNVGDTIHIVMNGDIVAEPLAETTVDDKTFALGMTGSFEAENRDYACTALTVDDDCNVVITYNEYVALKPFHAYMDADANVMLTDGTQASEAKGAIDQFDTDTTGIDSIDDDTTTDDRIYNLQGVQITNPVKGQVYIKNGHKFVQN